MTGVIYARYSSDNQREESIEGQLRECRAFAEKSGIEIVGTYIDRAFSARTDNRPDFQKMIKDSSGRKFEFVIVWKLDRFARDRYDSAHYKSILRKNGVKVLSATEKISDGSEGILMEAVLEGMAEYYSAELSEKVIRGMTENALKRKYNGGILPLGYTIDSERHFQVDPLTAPAVLAAFVRYAEGGTLQDIADEMNAKGIRSKFGNTISIDSAKRMLHNRRYIGEFKFRDIVDPNGVPAIVPKELFDRVQERMRHNQKAAGKHKADDEYLLTPKLFCGKCERLMVGESGKNNMGTKYRYYKCAGVKSHMGCDKKTVRKDWIEDLVIERILKVIFDDALIDSLADSVMELQTKENPVLPLLQKQYTDIQRGIDNLVNAIQQGIITSSTKERLEELERRKSELAVQMVKEEMGKPMLTKEQIVFWFHRFRKLNPKKLEHRRRLIDSFVNAVYLYDDHMLITFNYKDGTQIVNFTKPENSQKAEDCSGVRVSALPQNENRSRLRSVF
ncbi:MAG: recombinase family protein [Clostridia bacterium]|nr:recombinase family protein [Clostridia bacterium]